MTTMLMTARVSSAKMVERALMVLLTTHAYAPLATVVRILLLQNFGNGYHYEESHL